MKFAFFLCVVRIFLHHKIKFAKSDHLVFFPLVGVVAAESKANVA